MPVFRSPPPKRNPLPLPLPQADAHSQQHKQQDSSFVSNTSTAGTRRSHRISNASIPSTPSQAPTPSLYPALPTSAADMSATRNAIRSVAPAANDFPSLDAMAEVAKQKQDRNTSFSSSSHAAASRGFAVSSSSRAGPSSTTSAVQVPSSLPRPNKGRSGSLFDDADRPTTRRSSLTAMEAARQRAGSETPVAVASARVQRQVTAGAEVLDLSLDGDDGDETVSGLPLGPNGGHGANMSIDIESGKMPLPLLASRSSRSSTSGQGQGLPGGTSQPTAADTSVAPLDVDLSTASQKSRRNGEDRPISSGYDFSKYLEEGIDPFNANAKKVDRRQSRPLPVPAMEVEDEARESSRSYSLSGGDETLRGNAILSASQQPARAQSSTAPQLLHEAGDGANSDHVPPAPGPRRETSSTSRPVSGSMPPPSQLPRPQFKAPAAPTSQPSTMAPPLVPMQSTPRATPQAMSRKINGVAGFSVPGVPSVAANGSVLGHAAGDESSVTASAQKRRLDPAARTDRLMSLELAEAKKKVKLLTEKLEVSEDERRQTAEESDGWASEAARLEEDVTRLRSQLEDEASQLQKATSDLEAKVMQHKLEADDRQWRLTCQKRSFHQLEADLLYCKNESTYETFRGKETEADLLMEKDDLRIRLMAERKRSDLLGGKLRAKLKEAMTLRKRLSARTGGDAELRSQNERLTADVEALQAELDAARRDAASLRKQLAAASAKAPDNSAELEQLQQENEEMKEDIATYAEREEMMAETRRVWKKERKEMQAQIKELEAQLKEQQRSSKPAPKKKRAAEAYSDLEEDADDQVDPAFSEDLRSGAPSAAVSRKKALLTKPRRDPMQGASDAIPSEAELPASSPLRKASAKAKKPLPPSALGRASLLTKQPGQMAKRRDEEDDVESDAASEAYSDEAGESYVAPAPSKKGTQAKKATKAKAPAAGAAAVTGAKGKRAKAPVAVVYDDLLADPSATPMIRSKRSMEEMMAEDDEDDADAPARGGVEDSFRGTSRVARDRTNTATATAASAAAPAQPAAKKKKRKLLGGGAGGGGGGGVALGWGQHGGDENAALQPDYNIPLELSPIKPAAGGGRLGGIFGGGMGGRGPFG